MDSQRPHDRPTDAADLGDPTDRRDADGAAGRGDMLGGLSTGVGGRLGPDQGVERDGVTIPMSGDNPALEGQTVVTGRGDYTSPAAAVTDQHDLDAAEPATDADVNYHGLEDPA